VLTEHDPAAVAVLMVSGTTDWLDGKIARRWNQMSRVGELLDPLADRLYILATLVGLTVRDIVPLWLTLALVGRDLFLACFLPVLRRHGYTALPVHFLGKAATFNLLAGFPLLLLGEGDSTVSEVAHTFGWAFTIWGTALYWWAGVLYVVQVRRLVTSAGGAAPA
jgi:cardiolipin synthase (CMP-forming)